MHANHGNENANQQDNTAEEVVEMLPLRMIADAVEVRLTWPSNQAAKPRLKTLPRMVIRPR